jgi:preprotein translocase subunit SecG
VFPVLVVFHVIVCAGLILAVLMQSSKGEGLAGSSFGGTFSGAMFGGRGAASFLSRATSVLAVLFMLNCGALAFMSSSDRPTAMNEPGSGTESVISREAQKEREQMMQQQQQQQMGDTSAAAQGATVTPTTPNVTVTPTDTSGK